MKRIILFLFFSFCLMSQASAQLYPLPPNAQAIVSRKIFSYVKTLKNSGTIKLLVVYDGGKSNEKNAVVSAFRNENMDVISCQYDQISSYLKGVNIIYVSSDILSNSVKSVCSRHNILSITGSPSLVERGEASIGIGNAFKNLPGRKYKIVPRIIINLTQLQNEAQEVTELLSMDSVIKVK